MWNWIKRILGIGKPIEPVNPVRVEPVVVPIKPQVPSEKASRGGSRFFDKNGRLLINRTGIQLIQHFEGCYLKAYQDSVGVWTIAWGRIVYPDGRKVKKGDTCTQEQADAWLLEDIYAEGSKYVRVFLNDDVEAELNDDQFSALVGFCYNRGAGRFRDYVAPFINKRDFPGAMKSLCSVNWAGPDRKYLLGLDRRRWAERYLFEGKDWSEFNNVAKFQAFKNRGYRG